jgi:hypothetical protein
MADAKREYAYVRIDGDVVRFTDVPPPPEWKPPPRDWPLPVEDTKGRFLVRASSLERLKTAAPGMEIVSTGERNEYTMTILRVHWSAVARVCVSVEWIDWQPALYMNELY